MRLGAKELHFDPKNPRMVIYTDLDDDDKIINKLWEAMAVDEIVMSILANGFFENEPLYVVVEDNKYIVVEGNRRLAAARAILNPEIISHDGMKRFSSRITPAIVNQLNHEIPVVILKGREDAWRLIGFKHVNGAVKWDSFAKAEYIAQVHNTFDVSLEDIADQIGDSNKTTIRLYIGLMILEQAERETSFSRDDKYYSRLYFSHLYTAIGYDGFRNFLGITGREPHANPIPSTHINNLGQLMMWLFGSKLQDIKPIIRSQNPDLRNLNQVLLDKDSTAMLLSTGNFEAAYDNSVDGLDTLTNSIMEARVSVQKALSKLNFYDGDEDILSSAMTLADQADTLFNSMKLLKNQIKDMSSKTRSID